MRVGVVDIGTNSMRLLITDGVEDVGRWVAVTGLGVGVDATGRLSEEALHRTIEVLARFGALMSEHAVERRSAMATSATRDAVNREQLMARAEQALGVRPEVITGDREGGLAYAGATAGLEGGDYVVSDIGGGSTELVTAAGAMSVDIGSVRLSDRILVDRPPDPEQLERARTHVRGLFSSLRLEGELIGVAGTWTNIAGMDLALARYDREAIHHHRVSKTSVAAITDHLATLTVAETESIASLEPGRAPMILAGAVIAACVMDTVGADSVLVSERDTLDGLASELVAVT